MTRLSEERRAERIVNLLREAGAKEVHVRIASPPIENPCLYGIDMLTKKELIAANHTMKKLKRSSVQIRSPIYRLKEWKMQSSEIKRSIKEYVRHV